MKSRIFFLTYSAANAGLIFYGILALIQPEILLNTFIEHVYQIPTEAVTATAYLSGLYRLIGYFNIIPGVLGLLILHRYWLTRNDWYLKIVIAFTILAYLGPIVFDNTLGRIGFFEVLEHVLFVTIIISGFMMLKYWDSRTWRSAYSSSFVVLREKRIKSLWIRFENPTSGFFTSSER